MRLISFGCSFTFGQGLPDCYVTATNKPGILPSKFAWPQLLSNKLMLQCINLSEPGSSNKEILHKLLNFKFENDDIVVIMWSFPDRWCTISESGINRLQLEENIVAFDRVFTEYDLEFDLIYRANFAKLFLDRLNVKNYHLCVNTDFCKVADTLSWNLVSFDDINMCNIKLTVPPALDLDNPHPGIEAHKIVADRLYVKMLKI